MIDQDPFEDIRPYRDSEVRDVLDQVVADDEFVSSIVQLKYPRLSQYFSPLIAFAVRRVLKRAAGNINSVDDFQLQVRHYLEHALETSADDVTSSGCDRLEPNKAYLFICNHRDISMDPALCNLILHQNGLSTFRIAIGDNLLTKPYASHLMRLNKSFVVQRSVSGRREKLDAFKKLSSYIRQSIVEESESVWIAQREGRAKTGVDRTDAAILKMFLLSKSKEQTLSDAIRELHIVPVAVSYQWDPLDVDKARELVLKENDGEYLKDEHEDVISIAKGITGYKGNIHVAFGSEITKEFGAVDELVDEIDYQILSMYHLHDSNLAAHARLTDQPLGSELEAASDRFDKILAGLPTEYHQKLLESYANPVVSHQSL